MQKSCIFAEIWIYFSTSALFPQPQNIILQYVASSNDIFHLIVMHSCVNNWFNSIKCCFSYEMLIKCCFSYAIVSMSNLYYRVVIGICCLETFSVDIWKSISSHQWNHHRWKKIFHEKELNDENSNENIDKKCTAYVHSVYYTQSLYRVILDLCTLSDVIFLGFFLYGGPPKGASGKSRPPLR